MQLHDNEACKVKCDGVINTLTELMEMLSHPRSDREQHVKCAIEIVLQDVRYLANDIEGAPSD